MMIENIIALIATIEKSQIVPARQTTPAEQQEQVHDHCRPFLETLRVAGCR
jgi:hypothetical protein